MVHSRLRMCIFLLCVVIDFWYLSITIKFILDIFIKCYTVHVIYTVRMVILYNVTVYLLFYFRLLGCTLSHFMKILVQEHWNLAPWKSSVRLMGDYIQIYVKPSSRSWLREVLWCSQTLHCRCCLLNSIHKALPLSGMWMWQPDRAHPAMTHLLSNF